MGSRADAIVARARACVGIRFRAQGRGPEGIDCIGLVAASLGVEGVRSDYTLRGGRAEDLAHELERAGLRCVKARRAGDVLAMRAGPGQLHLGIWTGAGLVHADSGLRRVVERPGEVPWPIIGVWRQAAGRRS